MAIDIRLEIAERRSRDVELHGAAQGLQLPQSRELPVCEFLRDPGVICEVKRKYPSVSNINLELDPVKQAGTYVERGIKSISVLTEQNYFGGSLKDLMDIKRRSPDIAILRKDFLLSEEDVNVSYLAGADAFLLIASLLSAEQLEIMYKLGLSLGMAPLVELHSYDDVKKAEGLNPKLVGINSRNLKNFTIDRLQPLRIRSFINWDCRIVYESGIKTPYDVDFVKGTGFDAVLVGEAVVRDADFALKLVKSFDKDSPDEDFADAVRRFGFWNRLYKNYDITRPFVKICGITNHEDLKLVKELGADVAGFILADSPRKVSCEFIKNCSDFDIIKVGVVVLKENEPLSDDIIELLEEGFLDAVQFHGKELPTEFLKWPGYKAVRIKDEIAAENVSIVPGPSVLIDAFSSEAAGGTGKRIDGKLVKKVAEKRALWLAGGIKPENVVEIVNDYKPQLIDISSGVEAFPGKKDADKLKALFNNLSKTVISF
ncbi:MAG: bifunctional indole-3-glycerol phosphate synthase/phosphoribosylanthranilate isomerase [Spirochaetales bacterium]|nr:bifunctional indole-3-glycerol phosphate synthase/phosphoribosylanthranilate isomerase [Spirochaetales bacterium]